MDIVGDWCLDVRWDDRWMDRDQTVGVAAGTAEVSRGFCGRVMGGDRCVGGSVSLFDQQQDLLGGFHSN